MSSYRPLRSEAVSFLLIATGIVALVTVLVITRYLVLTCLVGIGLGILLSPGIDVMRNRFRIPKGLTAFLFAALFFLGIGSILYGIYALVADQASRFVQHAPEIFEGVRTQVVSYLRAYPWLEQQAQQFNFQNYARTAMSTIFRGIQNTAALATGILFVIALGLYVAIRAQSYFQGLLLLFPAYQRAQAKEVLSNAARMLRRWFRGQLIVISISGTATALVLFALGIDYWLLLGLLTAVLNFIPYIGAILTGAAAVLVTLGTQPDKALWVLALYLLIQQLEGDVTIPLVMKESVRLPEAPLLVFMLLLGGLFGFLGVFIASPLFAVAYRVYHDTYVRAMNEKTRPEGGVSVEVTKKGA